METPKKKVHPVYPTMWTARDFEDFNRQVQAINYSYSLVRKTP